MPGRGCARRDRGHRQDRDGRGGGERRDRPAGDEQQHEQEEDADEGGGEEREREDRAERTSGIEGGGPGVECRLFDPGGREGDNRRRGERDRDLGEEDRPPVEGLGQRSAKRGPGGEAEDRHRRPGAAARTAGVDQREGADQQRRAAERLRAAHDEQRVDRVGQAAAGRRQREQRRAAQRQRARGQPCDERQRHGQRARVDAEHRGGLLDRRIELGDDRRQRERDDRSVGQREAGGEEEQDADAPHAAKLPGNTDQGSTRWRLATPRRSGRAT